MFRKFFFLSFLCMLVSMAAPGQSVINEVETQIKEGNAKIILDLSSRSGIKNDTQFVNYLRALALDKKQRLTSNSPSYFAHIALAKLGDTEVFQQIVNETEANDPSYLAAMWKLSLVGGKPAILAYYRMLDDETVIKIDGDNTHVLYYPKSAMAIYHLSSIIENPPTKPKTPSNNVAIWKKWFEEHPEVLN